MQKLPFTNLRQYSLFIPMKLTKILTSAAVVASLALTSLSAQALVPQPSAAKLAVYGGYANFGAGYNGVQVGVVASQPLSNYVKGAVKELDLSLRGEVAYARKSQTFFPGTSYEITSSSSATNFMLAPSIDYTYKVDRNVSVVGSVMAGMSFQNWTSAAQSELTTVSNNYSSFYGMFGVTGAVYYGDVGVQLELRNAGELDNFYGVSLIVK